MDIDNEINPLVVASEIGFIISDGLRNGSISLYSAFLLNYEVLRLRRMGYHQPAWSCRLSVCDIVALYMHYLLALAANETRVASAVAGWLLEDMPQLAEQREHYLTKFLELNKDASPSRKLLVELSRIRSQYELISDDEGPFHVEVFPYDFWAPEDVLLGYPDTRPMEKEKLDPKTEELLLEIAVSKWG